MTPSLTSHVFHRDHPLCIQGEDIINHKCKRFKHNSADYLHHGKMLSLLRIPEYLFDFDGTSRRNLFFLSMENKLEMVKRDLSPLLLFLFHEDIAIIDFINKIAPDINFKH